MWTMSSTSRVIHVLQPAPRPKFRRKCNNQVFIAPLFPTAQLIKLLKDAEDAFVFQDEECKPFDALVIQMPFLPPLSPKQPVEGTDRPFQNKRCGQEKEHAHVDLATPPRQPTRTATHKEDAPQDENTPDKTTRPNILKFQPTLSPKRTRTCQSPRGCARIMCHVCRPDQLQELIN